MRNNRRQQNPVALKAEESEKKRVFVVSTAVEGGCEEGGEGRQDKMTNGRWL